MRHNGVNLFQKEYFYFHKKHTHTWRNEHIYCNCMKIKTNPSREKLVMFINFFFTIVFGGRPFIFQRSKLSNQLKSSFVNKHWSLDRYKRIYNLIYSLLAISTRVHKDSKISKAIFIFRPINFTVRSEIFFLLLNMKIPSEILSPLQKETSIIGLVFRIFG